MPRHSSPICATLPLRVMVSKKGRGRWRKGTNESGLAVVMPLLPPRLAAALSHPAFCSAAFVLCSCVDMTVAVALWRVRQGAGRRDFGRSVREHEHQDVADLVLLALARILAMTCLSVAAYHAATRKAPRRQARVEAVSALRQPLLGDVEAPEAGAPPAVPTPAPVAPPVEPPRPTHLVEDPHKRAKKAAKAAKAARLAVAATVGDVTGRRWKSGLQACSSVLVIASQVYIGIRAIGLPPDSSSSVSDAVFGAAMVAMVVMAYAEHGAATAAVDASVARAWASASQPAAVFSGEDAAIQILRNDAGPVQRRTVSQGAYLGWCFKLVATHLGAVTLGLLALVAGNACDLALPRVAGAALDAAVASDRAEFGHAVRVSAGLQAASGALGGIRGACFATSAAHVVAALSVSVYAALLRQDVAFFDAASTGDLLSRLTEDVKAATDPASWLVPALGRAIIQALGGALACVHISWRLTLLAGAATAPVFELMTAYARFSTALQRKRSDAMGAAAGAAGDALGNVRGVRAAGSEPRELRLYTALAHTARGLGVTDARAYALTVALNDWVTLGASLLVLAVGGHLVMRGDLSVGLLVAFQAYFAKVDASWQSALQFVASLSTSAGAAERVLGVLELQPVIGAPVAADDADTETSAPPPFPEQWPPAGGLDLAFVDVAFAYQQRPDARVLTSFSLHVPAGTSTALVGRSGCGKSTVVHLVMRFYDPKGGSITLGGTPLVQVPYHALRAAVALVAQDAPVFAGTVMHNITYGAPASVPTDEAAVHEAASAAAAADFITGFPEGYATMVGDRGIRLSAGQRQRVALARALLRRPRLLLADEATASLDAESERCVQLALDAAAASGRHTVLLVAHRLSTVRGCGTIAVVADGGVVESGSHEQSLARGSTGGIYARLIARQMEASERLHVGPTRLEEETAAAAAAALVGGEIEALIT
jgi:ABC-type multidrug transport system fused ATPase/permease subunit